MKIFFFHQALPGNAVHISIFQLSENLQLMYSISDLYNRK